MKQVLMVINFNLLLRFLVGGVSGLNASGLGEAGRIGACFWL